MITQEEAKALVELLNRVPMGTAERLWCQRFVEKLETLTLPQRKNTTEDDQVSGIQGVE